MVKTFSLIVALLYPDGSIQTFNMGPGISQERCEAGADRARTQLPSELVEAIVFSIDCVPDVNGEAAR